jgi:hypothetical protein
MMALIVQALTVTGFAPAVGAACAAPLSATAAANAKQLRFSSFAFSFVSKVKR